MTGDTIYATGFTNSLSNVVSPGCFQQDYGGGTCDALLVKFVDCNAPDTANLIIGPVSLCSPASGNVYSIPAIPTAFGYVWEVPSGATIVSGQNTTSVTVDFGTSAVSGYVRVRGTNACGTGEPTSLYVTITPAATPTIIGAVNVVQGMGYYYYTESGMTNYVF